MSRGAEGGPGRTLRGCRRPGPGAGDLWAAGCDTSGAATGTLSLVREKTGTVTDTVPLAAPPGGMAVDPYTGDLYVADGSGDGTVTVISRG